MHVVFEVEKVFVFKHKSIKSYSSPSSSVILFDGVENFLTRPWSPFRFNLNLSDVCVGVLTSTVCVCSYACIYIISMCLFTSEHMHAFVFVCLCEPSAITLRRHMINLCLTCLFTELLGGSLGARAACNAANNSSNEKMQMIRLDPAPNPLGTLRRTHTYTNTHRNTTTQTDSVSCTCSFHI